MTALARPHFMTSDGSDQVAPTERSRRSGCSVSRR
jgi:hypothetical protein